MTLADAQGDDLPLAYVNPAFERMTGYGAAEALGRNARFLQGPGTDPAAVARLKRSVASGDGADALLLNHRRDGSRFWNHLRVSPVRDGTGRLAYFVGVQSDITQRVEAEHSLRVSEERYRAAVESAEQLAAEQAALRRVATAVAEEQSPEAVFALAAKEATDLLDADATNIGRVVGSQGVEVMGAWSVEPAAWPVGAVMQTRPDGEFDRLRTTGTAYRIDRFAEGDQSPLTSGGHRSAVFAPILVDGRFWGGLAVRSRREAAFSMSAEQQLTRFASLLGMVVSSINARSKLLRMATTDPLTGLVNHRAMHQRLREEVHRALRHQRPLALVLIDVDDFRGVNETGGHQHGDDTLREVARRMSREVRVEDCLARVGGDEFALVLPETNRLEAYAVAEKVRQRVAETPILGHARVTVSAGVCDLDYAQDASSLYRLADGALYWAKRHGRDMGFVYDPSTVHELSANERADQLQRSQAMLGIRALARAIDAKDHSTREHSARVAELAARLGRHLGWSDDRLALLTEAALIHDVGKIGVPDHVLLKPGTLNAEEYATVKEHAELGASIVEDVLTGEQVGWVRHHHERPDGHGYPDGIAAEAIPDGAAILAVADAFDVMTCDRPYSAARSAEEALAECDDLRGRQFAPFAVDALAQVHAAPAR
jgi:diguanylate cyclase (GGDEF)-like protein/PAS domain S-box-containing protein